jgi:hypothetical protein
LKSRRRVNSGVRRLILAMIKYASIAFVIVLFGASASHGQSVPKDTVITLHRLTDGFGEFPEYTLTINADGTVTFKQHARFATLSRTHAPEFEMKSQIPVSTVAALIAAFERAKFFSLNDRYSESKDGCPWWHTDATSAQISITLNGKSKSIFHYHGCVDQDRATPYPWELYSLAMKIDELVNTEQWLKP